MRRRRGLLMPAVVLQENGASIAMPVGEALERRDEAKRAGYKVSFTCPACKELARVHGGKVTAHGEHIPTLRQTNGKLRLNDAATNCKGR